MRAAWAVALIALVMVWVNSETHHRALIAFRGEVESLLAFFGGVRSAKDIYIFGARPSDQGETTVNELFGLLGRQPLIAVSRVPDMRYVMRTERSVSELHINPIVCEFFDRFTAFIIRNRYHVNDQANFSGGGCPVIPPCGLYVPEAQRFVFGARPVPFHANFFNSEIGSGLRFSNPPSYNDLLPRKNSGNACNDYYGYGGKKHRVRPYSHFLLGLQIIVGAFGVWIGLGNLIKARNKCRHLDATEALMNIACLCSGYGLALFSFLNLVYSYAIPAIPNG
tara:strand:+ start:2005 stop:2844 length:840 start_codon:yes stop_codon:yes gene_type:complete